MLLQGTSGEFSSPAYVCVGGTFDIFHDGHRKLLEKAREAAGDGKLLVGITSDEFARVGRARKIRSFSERAETVASFLDDLGCRSEIVRLDDFHGPAATDPNFTGIAVSRDTEKNARRVNRMRKERALPPLNIIVIDMVCDENDIPLSSTRIAKRDHD